MKGLYKGRYLIALYDKDDYLLDVVCNGKELERWYKNENVAKSQLSHVFKGDTKCKKIYFIDIFENHNDIFKEEDEEFIKYFEKNRKKNMTEKAKENNVYVQKCRDFRDIESIMHSK